MDDFNEQQKPPLLLPEPAKMTATSNEAPPMDTSDDLAEVTEIEPRPEEHRVEEIEKMPIPRVNRPPQGQRHDQQRGGRRDNRGGGGGRHPHPGAVLRDSRDAAVQLHVALQRDGAGHQKPEEEIAVAV